MIRVLIVDDHEVVRQGLRYMLEQRPDIDVVGEGSNGEHLTPGFFPLGCVLSIGTRV